MTMAVSKRLIAIGAALVAVGVLLLATAPPAAPAIHEMVAAYCSGGGHGAIGADGFLEPPGITDFDKKNFAQPVNANGVVVDVVVGGELVDVLVTDKQAAKFPEGTSVFFELVSPTLSDHPSAKHCKALNP
jgi:hypothetical protein